MYPSSLLELRVCEKILSVQEERNFITETTEHDTGAHIS